MGNTTAMFLLFNGVFICIECLLMLNRKRVYNIYVKDSFCSFLEQGVKRKKYSDWVSLSACF